MIYLRQEHLKIMSNQKHKPVVLVILDGWGEWDVKLGNPIAHSHLPVIEKLNRYYPKLLLAASGESVGLPWGVMGNSEVGHQALGTGQIVYNQLPSIDTAIQTGAMFNNKVLVEAIKHVKKNNSRLHVLGLVSDGGVHSHIKHLFGLLEVIKSGGIKDVYIHAITDGRDTPPQSAKNYLSELLKTTKKTGVGEIATLLGRYYAMDRNKNWDRIEKAYLALTAGVGIKEKDPLTAIDNQYEKEIFDEYLEPVVMVDDSGSPRGLIKENDVVICFNFRGDRSRQITRVFTVPEFNKFEAADKVSNVKFICFTQYEEGLPAEIVFPRQEITARLGEVLSKNKKTQLRIAETEKYAHVTYFFNGGIEKPFLGEDWVLIPSKNYPSYADIPEMSAQEITDRLISKNKNNSYNFILVNYANPDMVGHTGDFKAGLKALKTVDECLDQLITEILNIGGCLIITADHGNIEEMIDLETGEIDTKHSTNPVPCWLVTPSNKRENVIKKSPSFIGGMIVDISPTILELMGIKKPKSMIGQSLIKQFSSLE